MCAIFYCSDTIGKCVARRQRRHFGARRALESLVSCAPPARRARDWAGATVGRRYFALSQTRLGSAVQSMAVALHAPVRSETDAGRKRLKRAAGAARSCTLHPQECRTLHSSCACGSADDTQPWHFGTCRNAIAHDSYNYRHAVVRILCSRGRCLPQGEVQCVARGVSPTHRITHAPSSFSSRPRRCRASPTGCCLRTRGRRSMRHCLEYHSIA